MSQATVMPLRTGITLGHSGESLSYTLDMAHQAEAAGFDMVGVGDTQLTQREVYCSLAALAIGTKRVRLGPLVTNPVTRHPSVIASAIATIDELSDGRAFLGIGHGKSATAQADLPPASTERYRGALEMLGRGVSWREDHVPIIVHANGLRAMRLAAELGDGVLLRWGDRPVSAMRERIEVMRSIRAAGPRKPRSFEVWVYVNAFIGDPAAGRSALRGVVPSRAQGVSPDEVPEGLRDAMSAYKARYDWLAHSSNTNLANYNLLVELGLDDYMFERFAVIGDVTELRHWLASLGDIGVDAVFFGMSHPDKGTLIDSLSSLLAPPTPRR